MTINILTTNHRVRIATIRDKGLCPCPRCLVPKTLFDRVGYIRDLQNRLTTARTYARDLVLRARSFIYNLGYGVSSAAVEHLLQAHSLVPTLVGALGYTVAYVIHILTIHTTQNAFGEKLCAFAFNPHIMLIVDLMHEIELGVWKNIFTHLIQILHAAAPAAQLVTKLDQRHALLNVLPMPVDLTS
jgi:hypothetical protein